MKKLFSVLFIFILYTTIASAEITNSQSDSAGGWLFAETVHDSEVLRISASFSDNTWSNKGVDKASSSSNDASVGVSVYNTDLGEYTRSIWLYFTDVTENAFVTRNLKSASLNVSGCGYDDIGGLYMCVSLVAVLSSDADLISAPYKESYDFGCTEYTYYVNQKYRQAQGDIEYVVRTWGMPALSGQSSIANGIISDGSFNEHVSINCP
jgi:hypothetical protein